MKRKSIFLSTLLLFFGCLVSCEDSEIPVYKSDDYISFKPDKDNTKLAYSFLGKPGSLVRDTLKISVNLIGHVADSDREVNVMVADSSTAEEGVDFDIVRPILLKKGTTKTDVKVVIYRTEALQETSRVIWLVMADSETLLRAERKDDKFETYRIEFSEDISALKQPEWWPWRFSQFIYSKTRHVQYINEIGSSDDPTSAIPGLSMGDSYYYVLYKLQTATKTWNDTHEEPLSDENGPISWEL